MTPQLLLGTTRNTPRLIPSLGQPSRASHHPSPAVSHHTYHLSHCTCRSVSWQSSDHLSALIGPIACIPAIPTQHPNNSMSAGGRILITSFHMFPVGLTTKPIIQWINSVPQIYKFLFLPKLPNPSIAVLVKSGLTHLPELSNCVPRCPRDEIHLIGHAHWEQHSFNFCFLS